MDISQALQGVAEMAQMILIGAAIFGAVVIVIGAWVRR